MAKRKNKKKSAPLFPPETGENKMPSPALQSPANAAAMASGFAGLGSVGSINEEEMTDFLNELRDLVWELEDAD